MTGKRKNPEDVMTIIIDETRKINLCSSLDITGLVRIICEIVGTKYTACTRLHVDNKNTVHAGSNKICEVLPHRCLLSVRRI